VPDCFLAAVTALAVAATAHTADPPAVVRDARVITTSGSLPFGRFGFPPVSDRPMRLSDEQVKLLFDYLEGDRRATVARVAGAEVRIPRGMTGHVLIPGPTRVREDRVDEEYGGWLLEPFPALSRRFTVPVVYRYEVRTYLVVSARVGGAVPVAPAPRPVGH
jgi:hypothetical protein